MRFFVAFVLLLLCVSPGCVKSKKATSVAPKKATALRPTRETMTPHSAPKVEILGAYYCHTEGALKTGASMCRPMREDCEDERTVASQENLTTSDCEQLSPVACFQLGGWPDDAHEWCAGSLQDCELWRGLDMQKTGGASGDCALRH